MDPKGCCHDSECDPLKIVPPKPEPTNVIETLNEPKPTEPQPEDETKAEKPKKPSNMSEGAVKLRSWLNKLMRIKMSDGRVLVGVFLCTDRDANVILSTCSEYVPEEGIEENPSSAAAEEPRMLGLVMVPGKHIVDVSIEKSQGTQAPGLSTPLSDDDQIEDVT